MDMDNIHGKEVHVLNVNSIGKVLKIVSLVYTSWILFIFLK